MADLSLDFCGVHVKNPVVVASIETMSQLLFGGLAWPDCLADEGVVMMSVGCEGQDRAIQKTDTIVQ